MFFLGCISEIKFIERKRTSINLKKHHCFLPHFCVFALFQNQIAINKNGMVLHTSKISMLQILFWTFYKNRKCASQKHLIGTSDIKKYKGRE